ncbi:MAG: ABC transporter substrate-binding protein [Candidatus Hydrogenedentota bacterium]|nr:MAG: ABC transporter substrate-binding protein [Candidatus Hydrogenedentota bacterium]
MWKEKSEKLTALFAIALAVVVAWCAPAPAAERECRITIVKSRDLPEYNVALEGFFEVMAKQGIQCETASYDLKGEVHNKGEMIGKIRVFKPDLILAVGTRATNVISKNFEETPIVFAMVLYPVASGFVSSMEKPGKNLTGATLDVPIELQLHKLSEIVPNLKRVGVLYSPKETLPVIEEAVHVAKSMNIQLLAEQVNSEGDVPDALRKLEKQKMDALWSVADGKVFTPPSARYIIKYALRRGLPFMGPHNGFVKAGALVALTADYRDNGRQTGEICVRILNGAKPANIAVAAPRTVKPAVNLQVAKHIGVIIPPSVLEQEPEIFQ